MFLNYIKPVGSWVFQIFSQVVVALQASKSALLRKLRSWSFVVQDFLFSPSPVWNYPGWQGFFITVWERKCMVHSPISLLVLVYHSLLVCWMLLSLECLIFSPSPLTILFPLTKQVFSLHLLLPLFLFSSSSYHFRGTIEWVPSGRLEGVLIKRECSTERSFSFHQLMHVLCYRKSASVSYLDSLLFPESFFSLHASGTKDLLERSTRTSVDLAKSLYLFLHQPSDRPFHNFLTSKSVVWHSWTHKICRSFDLDILESWNDRSGNITAKLASPDFLLQNGGRSLKEPWTESKQKSKATLYSHNFFWSFHVSCLHRLNEYGVSVFFSCFWLLTLSAMKYVSTSSRPEQLSLRNNLYFEYRLMGMTKRELFVSFSRRACKPSTKWWTELSSTWKQLLASKQTNKQKLWSELSSRKQLQDRFTACLNKAWAVLCMA